MFIAFHTWKVIYCTADELTKGLDSSEQWLSLLRDELCIQQVVLPQMG